MRIKLIITSAIILIIVILGAVLFSFNENDDNEIVEEEKIVEEETEEDFEKVIMSNPEISSDSRCEIIEYCNNLAEVDCFAAVDGPLYYVNKYSGEIVEYCGGHCFRPDNWKYPNTKYCRSCPPKEWTC